MTAELGLLNKTSIVLAADSAATILNHNKVFNTADKLFSLSKTEPIGIMIYNNSNWMGVPFEIIIKSYVKYLENKSLKSLEDYQIDFMNFLKLFQKQHVNTSKIKENLENKFFQILDELKEFIDKKNIVVKDKSFEELLIDELIAFNEKFETGDIFLESLENITFELFEKKYIEDLTKIIKGFCNQNNVEYNDSNFKVIFYSIFLRFKIKFKADDDYTGVVIAGYGTDEIYPTICNLRVGDIIADEIKFEIKRIRKIDDEITSIIYPFAQREVIDTLIQGYSNDVKQIFTKNITSEFSKIKKQLLEKYTTINENELDEIFKNSISNINKNVIKHSKNYYISPLIKSVGFLRKEDLIELSEAFINITSMNKKTNNSLQSVGGPIDIAYITKHEGFVWVKKKN
jgi:hypothetical protein